MTIPFANKQNEDQKNEATGPKPPSKPTAYIGSDFRSICCFRAPTGKSAVAGRADEISGLSPELPLGAPLKEVTDL